MCAVWVSCANVIADAAVRPRTNMTARTVQDALLINSLLGRELKKAAVPETFAEAFWRNRSEWAVELVWGPAAYRLEAAVDEDRMRCSRARLCCARASVSALRSVASRSGPLSSSLF